MITNGKPQIKETHMAASFSELARDVVELTELQGKLVAIDAVTAWQRMKGGLLLVVVGACVLLACLPIVLLIGAYALIEFAGWSHTAGMAVAGGGGLVIASMLLAVAYYRLKTMLEPFNRSREELSDNLAWLKAKLQRAQPAPHREHVERPREVAMPS